MEFKCAPFLIALAFLYFSAEPAVSVPVSDGDFSAKIANPDDSNNTEVDIQVNDPELPIGVNIIDVETLRSGPYVVLYGGTGSPDSTPSPFPLSVYQDKRKAQITLYLFNNETQLIDSAQLPPIADFIPEGATKVLIQNASVVDGIGLIEFTNLAPERSIILMLVNPSTSKVQISLYAYNGTDASVPPIVFAINNYLSDAYIVVTTRVPPSNEVKGLKIIYIPPDSDKDEQN